MYSNGGPGGVLEAQNRDLNANPTGSKPDIRAPVSAAVLLPAPAGPMHLELLPRLPKCSNGFIFGGPFVASFRGSGWP